MSLVFLKNTTPAFHSKLYLIGIFIPVRTALIGYNAKPKWSISITMDKKPRIGASNVKITI